MCIVFFCVHYSRTGYTELYRALFSLYLLVKMKNKGNQHICSSIANVYLCSTVRLCIQSLGVACNIIWIFPYLSIRLTYSRRNSEKIILSKVCTNLNIHILFLYVLYSRNYMFSQPSSLIHIFYHGAYILYTCSSHSLWNRTKISACAVLIYWQTEPFNHFFLKSPMTF